MQRGPVTPKGFGDIMPEEAKKRRMMIGKIADVLESYGFSPIETPTVEFADTLLGKYGEDEKLIYQFEDKGGRRLALRYDLTVPLARFIANNIGVLSPTFSRYQIGQCFRGENPQKGRKREFTQFDFDIAGSVDSKDDAKIITAAVQAAKAIGFKNAVMEINDRRIFDSLGFTNEQIITIDKIDKIGREEVRKLVKGFDKLEQASLTPKLKDVFMQLKLNGLEKNIDFIFNPYLARGLNYYTSTIFELKLNATPGGLSIGGGGRYDNLIGMFADRPIPAIGFSFGIDRIVDLMDN